MFLGQVLLLFLIALASAAPSADYSKVEPSLQASLRDQKSVNIFVKFDVGKSSSVIRPSQSLRFADRTQKINHLVSSLKSVSESSQRNVLNLLRRSPRHFNSVPSFTQFWISNELYVRGATDELVAHLATLPEVTEVREEQIIQLEELSQGELITSQEPEDDWNLHKVEAPQAWGLQPGGSNGSGIVVGEQTKIKISHAVTAITDFQYKQKPSSTQGPDTLMKPFVITIERAMDGLIPTRTESPVDDTGHGTHCIGSAIGAGIGIAPGAEWIACRGCGPFGCGEAQMKACGQWVLCPTLPNGQSADCSKAPRISTNSWGGGGGSKFYNDIIEAWKAADIIPVFAIGNGLRCNAAVSPGDQDVIGVGATGPTDALWEYSNMGPSVEGVLKPDISAPGHQIRSSWHTNNSDYYITSGTSMATPHVAGAIAVLLSQNPSLKYPEVKALLENNVDKNLPDTGYNCGGIPSTQFPNHQYGHGRMNVRKALEASMNGLTK